MEEQVVSQNINIMLSKEDSSKIIGVVIVVFLPFWVGSHYADTKQLWPPWSRFWGATAEFLYYLPYSKISSWGLSGYNNLNFILSLIITTLTYVTSFIILNRIIFCGSKIFRKYFHVDPFWSSINIFGGFHLIFSLVSLIGFTLYFAYLWLQL